MSGTILLDIKWDVAAKRKAFEAAFPDRRIALHGVDDYQPGEIDYCVVWQPEEGVLASLPNLKVIFSLGAGVDHVLRDPTLPDLPLVRFVDKDLTGRMVEWITLQVLMHLRGQPLYDRQQRERVWEENDHPAASDIRVGIMGFGELGQATAKVLLALGFRVNGWARSKKECAGVKSYAGEEERDAFLAATDILVSLLPLTPETTGVLNRALFEKLSRDNGFGAPVLINAGRGGSQVESDIAGCLQDGTLHAASLDVFETEPLPADSPLWALDNLIITPHMAAVSSSSALANHVKTQVERFEDGKPLQHVVDRSRGY